jgi:hypothetical protein
LAIAALTIWASQDPVRSMVHPFPSQHQGETGDHHVATVLVVPQPS